MIDLELLHNSRVLIPMHLLTQGVRSELGDSGDSKISQVLLVVLAEAALSQNYSSNCLELFREGHGAEHNDSVEKIYKLQSIFRSLKLARASRGQSI